jgi:hypothetical protein
VARGSTQEIADSAAALSKAITDRWAAGPLAFPDLYSLVFDGTNEGDRALLRDTAHTGEE